jgi:predicted enzyme related to lactoylglutathione lyase
MPDRGRYLWLDLVTPDPAGAVAFYPAVTGWGTTTAPGDGHAYTMWTWQDTPLAGIRARPPQPDAQPHWLAYIGVPDVDAAAAHAVELGGRVLEPTGGMEDVGRWAVLADPQGAMFAAFQPAREMAGPQGDPGTGHFVWHELGTSDPGAALAFYGALFGWEQTGVFEMGKAGSYHMYGVAGQPLGGMYHTAAAPPAMWLPYVRVGDLAAAVAATGEHGGRIVNGPMEVPGGARVAMALDPRGAAFALHELAG